MTRFLLIRHALTDFTGKRLSGRTPGVFLNAEGREQSLQLANKLAGTKIDALYSSPLERAVETCRPIADTRHLSWKISEDFMEINFGKWTNLTIDELRNDPEFVLFNSCRSSAAIPGGEFMHEAQSRIVSGLQKLYRKHKDETVGVVSHADLIISALAFYAAIPLDMMNRLEISPASLSIIEIYDHTAKIVLLNDSLNHFPSALSEKLKKRRIH